MAEFTVEEVENVGNAAIEFHYKTPEVRAQTLQDKPLLKAMMSKMKTFPGGKDNITVRVKGIYSTDTQGFVNDDSVTYGNPGNIRKATWPWKLLHAGIQVSMHELLIDGISVVDSSDGKGERYHSGRDKTVLANIMKDKVDDMMEGSDRANNLMFWRDGTADPKKVPGLTSFILNDPTSATVVGGIDQSANTWWRNRASLALTASTASDQNVVQTLQGEFRQLRRYGGRPNKALCGSDWLDWVEKELRSKGNYTLEGWAKSGKIDASVADISFKGIEFEYDPTLDDESKAKYCYILDTNTIFPMAIEGEDGKDHNPKRPENKYVFYRAKTWAWGLICNQRNANGVYSIA